MALALVLTGLPAWGMPRVLLLQGYSWVDAPNQVMGPLFWGWANSGLIGQHPDHTDGLL